MQIYEFYMDEGNPKRPVDAVLTNKTPFLNEILLTLLFNRLPLSFFYFL